MKRWRVCLVQDDDGTFHYINTDDLSCVDDRSRDEIELSGVNILGDKNEESERVDDEDEDDDDDDEDEDEDEDEDADADADADMYKDDDEASQDGGPFDNVSPTTALINDPTFLIGGGSKRGRTRENEVSE